MTARDWALAQLDQCDLPGWSTGELRRHGPVPTDPRDLGLAEQIFVGVVKNHLMLLHHVELFSGRKRKSIDPLVQKILSVGLYQLRFLDRVPASAVVNEAVEQAKRFGRTKAAGFVNAILRKAAGNPGESTAARLKNSDPARYAELELSHPRELFNRLANQFGPEAAIQCCEHDNREPPTIVRLLPGVVVEQLHSPGVMLTPHERPRMFVVNPAKKPLLAKWAREALAQVQDPTAAGVIDHCPIQPGDQVLDRCAGLGTKTFQLRDKAGNGGHVVAIDPAVERCRQLRSLLAERKIGNVDVFEAAMIQSIADLNGRQFGLALLDVPCSNSGVMARRPEARYHQTPAAMFSLEKLQNAILDDTADSVRAGGHLVYSTCSIWPEENERQVERFLARRADFALVEEYSTPPSFSHDPAQYHDGGYWALLRRKV